MAGNPQGGKLQSGGESAMPCVPAQCERTAMPQVSKHPDTILNNATVKKLIGTKCDGVIGQLTEVRKLMSG